MTTRFLRILAWLGSLCALAVGCAALDVPEPPAENVSEKRQQRADEAVRLFEEKRDFAEFQAASTRWTQGDLEGCQQALLRLLRRNGDHRDARLLLADLYLADNRPTEALEEVQQALELHPDDARAQHTMGLLLDATGQHDAALAYYEQAAEAEPENEVYAVGYHAALEAARRPQASSLGAAASPLNAPGPEQTGYGNHAGFATVADDADSAPPRTPAQRGHQALSEGSWEVALAEFREAAATSPDNLQILISGAVAALRYDQPDLALELLAPAEKYFAGTPEIHRIRGAAFYRLEDYRSSQVALQQALSLDKSSALTYFLLGCTLAELGQFESAEAHLEQARAIDPRYVVRQ